MRSSDEFAATSAVRRVGPRARPRDAGQDHPSAAMLEETPVLEAFSVPEVPQAASRLRGLLVGVDAVAASFAWVIGAIVPAILGATGQELGQLFVVMAVGVAVALFTIASQGLYRSRVCAVRAVETARLGRAAAVSAAAGLLVASLLDFSFGFGEAVFTVVVAWFLLSACRGLYTAWLSRARSQGRFCRPVVVVGTGDEGYELFRLVDNHPELGLRVVGVVGRRHSLAKWDGNVSWLGDISDASEAIETAGANGVIVAVSDLGAEDLNRVTRELLKQRIHVQLSSGLRGIDQRRLRSLPLAHEPLFYLEPASLSRWQLRTKRAMDVVLAGITVVIASPVLAAAAIAVKLGDGGPVLFRQTRVGQDGSTFRLFKLRTMVVDAEERLVDLTFANERQDGPLFKLTQDPRRTKVGRILELTSLDELPQLFNVLRGDMSLVGPRPALPHEVAQFDEELRARHEVLPGITGLWQVEGRENPAFDVYRRLDLFYVENWSVGFDLAILMATLQSVLLRFVWRSEKVAQEPYPNAAQATVSEAGTGSSDSAERLGEMAAETAPEPMTAEPAAASEMLPASEISPAPIAQTY
jgi:exopolysaccharide biosynthesis polyprenyl glycosylphosphotransferase